MSEGRQVDRPTRRLGAFVIVVYAVPAILAVVRLGSGSPPAVVAGVVVWCVVMIAAGFCLRRGQRWARTALVASFGLMLLVVAVRIINMLAMPSLLELLYCAAALFVVFVWLVAVSFSVQDAEPALPFPEDWREWATDRRTHLFLLVVGLLSALWPG